MVYMSNFYILRMYYPAILVQHVEFEGKTWIHSLSTTEYFYKAKNWCIMVTFSYFLIFSLDSYFWSNGEEVLESNYYLPKNKRICWSIVYSIKSVSGNGYLEVELQYRVDSHARLTEKLEYYQVSILSLSPNVNIYFD